MEYNQIPPIISAENIGIKELKGVRQANTWIMNNPDKDLIKVTHDKTSDNEILYIILYRGETSNTLHNQTLDNLQSLIFKKIGMIYPTEQCWHTQKNKTFKGNECISNSDSVAMYVNALNTLRGRQNLISPSTDSNGIPNFSD